MDFLFTLLPFQIKGQVLSFLGDYVFRKGRMNEIFMCRIPREKIAETKILFEKIPQTITWKCGSIWRSYVEFSDTNRLWRIIRQNYEYWREIDKTETPIPEIVCFYEKRFYLSEHVYQIPV